MALIYKAQLTPTKVELLSAWVPSQPWWSGDTLGLEVVGAYRFDDPGGEVGIETHLLKAEDGAIVQVPLTYRAAPLDDAGDSLVGTTQHSVLGERWVYDGAADPVYATALATAILTGGTQADLQFQTDDGIKTHESTTRVAGDGHAGREVPSIDATTVTTDAAATRIRADSLELVVRRALDPDVYIDGALTLTGVWPGNDEPVVLALARALPGP